MTGSARLRGSVRDSVAFTLAMKSVNHRFLDLNLRLPSQCDGLEVQMRRLLKERLKRGHVEVTLQIDRKAAGQMQLNSDLLEMYVQAYREAAALHGVNSEPDLNAILRIPGVISTESGFSKDDAAGLDMSVLA